jgi:tripartite-type tricarboxylate transporter receptor subunit TctC
MPREEIMKRICLLLGLVLAASTWSATGSAQTYPTKPIRIIVPFPPGGATDTIARRLSQPLAAALGQPVLIENRPGANAIIGMEACARADADGYTFCIANNDAINFNPSLYAKLPYDPAKDLRPIAKVGEIEQLIIANGATKETTLAQFLDRSKNAPVTWSSFGNGSMGHLYIDWFNSNAGSKLVHVPYKGAGPALEAVIKGEVDVSLFATGAALPHVKSGRLKPLAIIDTKRSSHLPDVSTLPELKYDFVVRAWLGMFAPKGVPDSIATLMNREVSKVLADPELQQKLRSEQAIETAPNTIEEFTAFIRADEKVAATQLRAAGIRLD